MPAISTGMSLRYGWFEIVGSLYPMRKHGHIGEHLIRAHGTLLQVVFTGGFYRWFLQVFFQAV